MQPTQEIQARLFNLVRGARSTGDRIAPVDRAAQHWRARRPRHGVNLAWFFP